MCRWDGEGVWACMSVLVLGGGYPEAQIVIDWPGRTVMQIHSSRLMFCHSALSAIKLAPVLKSPADNVAEAEITLHFPCAFLHLHPCHSHSEIYFTSSAAIGRELSRHPDLLVIPDLQLYVRLVGFFSTQPAKQFLNQCPLKVFNHFLVVVLPQN